MSRKNAKNRIRNIHILNEKTPFQIVEAFKSLRLNLIFALPNVECKKVLFTSALPNEGKTTTCVNTAIALSQMGSKVLVIDSDLRKPVCHLYFKTKYYPGLTNFLCGLNELGEVISHTSYNNLDFMPSGLIPPNPSELIASKEFQGLLKTLEEYYEYIIIDSPPVNVVSDALSISKEVSGTIIVTRQNISTHDQVQKALNSFKLADTKVLGFVLNDSYEENILGYKKKYGYRGYKEYS